MSLAIRVAARLLPSGIRERYREQWLADARDAPEVGLRPTSIALAALRFAVTYDRPLSVPAVLTPELVERRARLAAGLALSAALLGLAGFARLGGSGGLSGFDAFDVAIGLTDVLLLSFAIVGSLVAVAIVTRTREIKARVRIAVWVLMVSAGAPIAQIALDSFPVVRGDAYFALGGLAYVPATLAVIVALWLLWTGLSHPEPRARERTWVVGSVALAVLGVGSLGYAIAAHAWRTRTPISWSWLPGYATTMSADGTVVQQEIVPTRADYEQWLALKAQFESLVNAAFVAYAALTVVTVVALVLLALVARIRPGVLAAAATGMLFVAAAALLWRLDLNLATPLIAPELLLAVGRLLLVGVVLYSVDHRRYLPRVRHRHDVESSVELL